MYKFIQVINTYQFNPIYTDNKARQIQAIPNTKKLDTSSKYIARQIQETRYK